MADSHRWISRQIGLDEFDVWCDRCDASPGCVASSLPCGENEDLDPEILCLIPGVISTGMTTTRKKDPR